MFKYGEAGSLFYIILDGTVGIKLPTPKTRTWSEYEYFNFLLENYDNLMFERMNVEERIMK